MSKNFPVLLAVVTAIFFSGCSSKSPEDKAAEKAISQLQKVFGEGDPSEKVVVAEATAKEWPKKFCSLEINMSRDEVQAVMGTPTGSSRNQDANQDRYEAWDYNLTIFYDINDNARQIQPNSDNVPCETKFTP